MTLRERISGLVSRTEPSVRRPEPKAEVPAPLLPRFPVGKVIAGRYRIESYLAQGGMGEVYAATDTLLESRVALKFLRVFLAGDPQAEARFRREVKLAQQVQHPGVCRTHNLDVHEGHQFCVMELLDGETLAARLDRDGPLPIPLAVSVTRQICAALDAAHRVGVVHRDLKPGNIFLIGERAVITDFGLARIAAATHSLTPDDAVIGTLAYMAPEQVERGLETSDADVYALGAVMYEMVTGILPHGNGQPVSLVVRKLRQQHTRPRSLRKETPLVLEECIQRCLNPKPAGRPKCTEIVAALENGRASFRYQWTGGQRRLEWVMAGVVVAAAAVGGGNLVSGWTLPPEEAQRYYERGQMAMSDQSPARTVKLLEKALSVDPGYLEARSLLAVAQNDLDQLDAARDSILRAISDADRRWWVRRSERLAIAGARCLTTRDFQGAAEAYKELARISGGHGRTAAVLGQVRSLAAGDQLDAAIGVLQELLSKSPDIASARVQLARLYVQRRRANAAVAELNRAEALYRAEGNMEGLADLLLTRTMIQDLQPMEESSYISSAMKLAEQTGNRNQYFTAKLRASEVARRRQRFDQSEKEAREVVTQALNEQMPAVAAAGYSVLGLHYVVTREFDKATAALEQAVELASKAKNHTQLALARLRLGEVFAILGDAKRAAEVMEPAIRWYEERKDARSLMVALRKWGDLLVTQKGRHSEAEAAYRRSQRYAAEVGHRTSVMLADQRLGGYYFLREPRKAVVYYDAALKSNLGTNDRADIATGLRRRGSVFLWLGELDRARADLAEAERIGSTLGSASAFRDIRWGNWQLRAGIAHVEGRPQEVLRALPENEVQKMTPPFRLAAEREILWAKAALGSGTEVMALARKRVKAASLESDAVWEYAFAAEVALMAKQWGVAREMALGCLAIADSQELAARQLACTLLLRKAEHELGNGTRVGELTKQCLELSRRIEMRPAEAFGNRPDYLRLWKLN